MWRRILPCTEAFSSRSPFAEAANMVSLSAVGQCCRKSLRNYLFEMHDDLCLLVRSSSSCAHPIRGIYRTGLYSPLVPLIAGKPPGRGSGP
jgi:hypothetical protein